MHPSKKYFTIAIATFVVCLAIFIADAILEGGYSQIWLNIVQIIGICVACLMGLFCVLKNPKSMTYRILLFSLICYLLGELYWSLHYLVRGFYTFGGFTISDIPYVGIFIFLLAIEYELLFSNTPATKRRSILPYIAWIFILFLGIFAFIQGTGIVAAFIYTGVLAPTMYLAVRLLTIPSKKNSPERKMKAFHLWVTIHVTVAGIWLLPAVTSSNILFTLTEILLIAVPLMYVPLAVLGDEKCQNP